MSRALLIVLTSISLVGCGESSANDGSGGSRGPGGLASLGIDPLGRGDGFDLTESDYTGACYEDEALEANRPTLPDPRVVAAEEADAIAAASQAAADDARDELEAARVAFAASFEEPDVPDPSEEDLDAGAAYVAATALALVTADAALNTAKIIFSELSEEEPTWNDIFEDFTLSKLLLIEFKPEVDLGDGGAAAALLGFLSEAIAEEQKIRILDFLESTRDAALVAFNLAVELFCENCSPEALLDEAEVPRERVASAEARDAFVAAQAKLEAAEAQSVAVSQAAYEALIFAHTAPSDLPPCDSEELRQTLHDAFCTGDFVNPITPEEEAMTPGITATLDAYIAEVCAAVQ
jgi:hypothetical protein